MKFLLERLKNLWKIMKVSFFNLFKSKSNHSNKQKESKTIRQRFAEQPNEQPDTTDMPDLES